MTTLIIGMTIGLTVGVLITILSLPKEEDSVEFNMMDGVDEQFNESGFIDIPIHQIVSENENEIINNEKILEFRKRLNKFKNKNRFYK